MPINPYDKQSDILKSKFMQISNPYSANNQEMTARKENAPFQLGQANTPGRTGLTNQPTTQTQPQRYAGYNPSAIGMGDTYITPLPSVATQRERIPGADRMGEALAGGGIQGVTSPYQTGVLGQGGIPGGIPGRGDLAITDRDRDVMDRKIDWMRGKAGIPDVLEEGYKPPFLEPVTPAPITPSPVTPTPSPITTPTGPYDLPTMQPGEPTAMDLMYGRLPGMQKEISDLVMGRLREPTALTEEQMKAQYEPYFNVLDREQQEFQKQFVEQANLSGMLRSGRMWEELGERGFGYEQMRSDMMQNLMAQDIDRQRAEQSTRISEAMGMGSQMFMQFMESEAFKLGLDKFELARELGIDDQEMQRISLQANLENMQINQLLQGTQAMFGASQQEISQMLNALAGQQNQMMQVGGMGYNFQPMMNPYALSYAAGQMPGYNFGADLASLFGGG